MNDNLLIVIDVIAKEIPDLSHTGQQTDMLSLFLTSG